MASYNRVILVGNLTRDPEVKYTTGGVAIAEISLAVNSTWFDKKSNERKEETTFVEVTFFGRQAEVAGEYLAKGRPVLVEGRLKYDSWDDKETGKKRSKLYVVCENMQMLGSRGDGGGGGGGSGSTAGGGNRQSSGNRSSSNTGGGGGNYGGGGSSGGGNTGGDAADSYYDAGPPSVSEDDVPF